MKNQSNRWFVASLVLTLVLSSCGKKNNTSTSTSKRDPIQQILNNTSQNGELRTIQLSKIKISNAMEFSDRPGVTSIRGFITASIDAVMPCTLKNVIDLKRSLNGNIPLVSLSNVHVDNRKISNGSLETFGILRNGKPQILIGMSLRGNDGVPLVGHQNDYSDGSVDAKDCTQMMSETYQFLNANGSVTRRTLHINTVLKGNEVVKSTMLVDENRIMGIQIEKKNGKDVIDQYCVNSATLATQVR